MTGKIVYQPAGPHGCEPPPSAELPAGTIWRCDCGRYWKRVQEWPRWEQTSLLAVAISQAVNPAGVPKP